VIAFRPYVSPEGVVQAQGSFAGVQFTGGGYPESFFDTRTGEIYHYDSGGVGKLRLTKLGAPWVKEK
jgi:hypothetical protein